MTAGPHFRVVPSSPSSPPAGSELIECASGDGFLIAREPDGGVLLSLDDVDDCPVPTVRMTQLEARRLAVALMHYADRRQIPI